MSVCIANPLHACIKSVLLLEKCIVKSVYTLFNKVTFTLKIKPLMS